MESPVTDQVAIVTGAGQGIGRAIALRLANEGMRVGVADREGELAERVAAEIRAAGRDALALAVDVTLDADRQRLIATTLAHFKRLDALINNAGVLRLSLPLEVTDEHWDLVMAVNAKAVYFCCQLALRHMIHQRSGRIVNIASILRQIHRLDTTDFLHFQLTARWDARQSCTTCAQHNLITRSWTSAIWRGMIRLGWEFRCCVRRKICAARHVVAQI